MRYSRHPSPSPIALTQVIHLIVLMLITVDLHAKSARWLPLRSIGSYSQSDYRLPSSVKCLEIRSYDLHINTNKRVKKPANIVLSLKSSPIDKNLFKRFKKIEPNLSLSSDIRKDEIYHSITNAMVISSSGKMLRMYEIEDVMSFLGEIDTPAKLQLLLWLHGYEGYSHRKISQGYAVKIKQKTTKCMGESELEENFVYQLSIGKQGKINKKKILEHTKRTIKREIPLMEKPAIYLYPKTSRHIDLSLTINGTMTTSIPTYQNGWSVNVDSNGTIEGGYDYLFYENTLNDIKLQEEGWIKSGDEMEALFDTILPKLGFNSKEQEQFEAYWLEQFDKNKLYEIKLFDMQFISKNMRLSIEPKPDTLIRVLFSFRVIEERYKLNVPKSILPKRKGFVVFEWGGMMFDER